MSSSISSSDAAAGKVGEIAYAAVSGPRRFLVTMLGTVMLGIAVFWTLTANLRDGFLPGEYPMWQAKQQMVGECRLPDTIMLGDSRAVAGFDPAHFPDSVNLAMGGATPIELYTIASHVLECPSPPKRVLLSLSVPQLVRTEYFWQRTALFGFLSFDQLEDLRRRARALGDHVLFPAPTVGDVDATLTNWLYAHHFPSFYSAYLLNEAVVGRLRENQRIGAHTLQNGGHHLYGTLPGSDGISEDADIGDFQVAPILNDYMRRMLALFAARGIEVDFVGVPMNDTTYAHLAPPMLAGFHAYMAQLARENGLRVVGDPVPHWPDRWFGDSTHLNQDGAVRFSDEMAKTLPAVR